MTATNTMAYKGHFARVEFDADSVAALVEAFYDAVDDYVATCEKMGNTNLCLI